MDSQSNASTTPVLCARGCGFYGSAATRNLCSKCHNDYLKALISATSDSVNKLEPQLAALSLSTSESSDQSESVNALQAQIAALSFSTANDVAASGEITMLDAAAADAMEEEGSSSDDPPTVTVKSSSTRCQCCRRKVGLLGFHCRCGQVFCGVHRYPAEHSCTFDFKTFDRQNLMKQNPLIKADKLELKL